MTCFCMLPYSGQMTWILLTYLACLMILILLLYRASHRRAVRHTVVDSVLLLGALGILLFLMRCNQGYSVGFHVPAIVLRLAVSSILVYVAAGLCYEWHRSKREINEWSIKETMDDLPAGLCFADGKGRVILCNRKMDVLSHMLIGRRPQTLSELNGALEDIPKESGVAALTDVSHCYRFPDGKVYRFRWDSLSGEELSGYTQLSAHDETAIYEGNVRLRESTEELKRVNQKLQRLYERMADDVREKESLELKVYLHDTLGRSLLTVQDVKNSTSSEVKEKLKSLKEAVGVLFANRPTLQGTLEEARQQAAQMGVTVTFNGYIPLDSAAEGLIAAAVRECVTNCLRHARGDVVRVKVTERRGILRTEITNNGTVPKEPITEGSGLSSLRRRVEAAGGEMYLSHQPAFSLVLHLPREEERL